MSQQRRVQLKISLSLQNFNYKKLQRKSSKSKKIFGNVRDFEKTYYSFRFKCSAKHLDKKDLLGKSDPYFKIYRSREVEDAPVVFESEVIMKTLDPQWKESKESLQKICNSDLDRALKFEVYDWDKLSSHDLM